MIKPTVGRVVWYVPDPTDEFLKSDQVCAAIIAYVHAPDLVNLMVIGPGGDTYCRERVDLLQDGASCAYCTWMPYQKGQAAKTEELEKQVAGAAA